MIAAHTPSIRERPILFSSPMVTAILEGRKTMTRRVVKPQRFWGGEPMRLIAANNGEWIWNAPDYPDGDNDCIRCPYGQVGDRLWVRETIRNGKYAADDARVKMPSHTADPDKDPPALKSIVVAIHMPRWASRITLQITGVRVERLQAIRNDDIVAEGIDLLTEDRQRLIGEVWYQDRFASLWDKINGDKHPWASNPWVWVVEFRRIEWRH